MPLSIDTIGLHPASALCLEALQWLHERERFTDILEIGCGNGILSLTAASIWDAQVIAGDISGQAIEDTRRNIELQGIAGVTAVRSDGFEHAIIRQHAPYGLIIGNLLAELLVRLAKDMKNHSMPDGYLVLSGMLSWKVPETLAIYNALGFELIKEFTNSPWNCYILCHKAK